MNEVFDDVDVARLRRRRTVKWTLYGPEVLAAWVAEMDFDVAPVVRAAILEAVDREDFGYVEGRPQRARRRPAPRSSPPSTGGSSRRPGSSPVADVLAGIATALDVFVAPGAQVVVPTPAYPPFFEVVELTGRPGRHRAARDRGRPSDTLDLDAIESPRSRAGAGARAAVQPAQPDRARVHRGRAARARRDRRSARRARRSPTRSTRRWCTHRARHVPYATVSDAAAAHTVTVTSASKAFNLAGSQVRAGRHDEPRRRGAVARPARVRGRRVRRRSGSRRRSRRTATAGLAGRARRTYLDGNRRRLGRAAGRARARSRRRRRRRRRSSRGSTARRSDSTTRLGSSSTRPGWR